MIRKTLPALLVLGALAAAPASAQDGGTDSPAPPAPAEAPADTGPKLDLKLQAKKGDAFRYKNAFKTVMSMGGMEMNDISMDTVIRLDVEDVAENGNLTLKVTHEHVKGLFKSPMTGDIAFDSNEAIDDSNPMAAQIAPAFLLFTKGPIHLTVTPAGEVTELKGAEELFNEHLGDSQMAAMMAAQYSNEVQRQQFQGSFVRFAPEALPVGGTWKIESSSSMGGMTMNTVTDNTLKGSEGDNVSIEGTSKAGDEAMGLDITTSSAVTVSAKDGMAVSLESSTKAIVSAQGVEQTIETKLVRIGLDEVVVKPKETAPTTPGPGESPDSPAPPVEGPGETRDGETRDDG